MEENTLPVELPLTAVLMELIIPASQLSIRACPEISQSDGNNSYFII